MCLIVLQMGPPPPRVTGFCGGFGLNMVRGGRLLLLVLDWGGWSNYKTRKIIASSLNRLKESWLVAHSLNLGQIRFRKTACNLTMHSPFPCSALLGLANQPDPLGGLAEHVAVVAQDVDLVLLPAGAAH